MTEDPAKVNARIARYRERQQRRGMVVVRVWVPTKENAETIKRIAAEMRAAVVNPP